ncbi:hypothetical protein [Streptomyces sp. NPDC050416]|uniref:hypothetical protein n=1 Tax=Streptomyces sp. NPDC050416 TaxID=3365611 RepID=UPI00379E810A
MLNAKICSLAAAAIVATSAISPWSTSASAQAYTPTRPPESGWYNTGPEEQNQIFDSGSVRISWGPVYVEVPNADGDPSWIYYVIRYENYSGTPEELDCEGYAQPDTAKQLIAPTENDLGEPFYAAQTVCSDAGGQWSTTLSPGETLELGAWFDEVPSIGNVVSLELQDEFGYPGYSEYQNPYWERYDGPAREAPGSP